MGKFFCPECGYDGDEPICPHCNIPAEPLEVGDDLARNKNDKYPDELLDEDSDGDNSVVSIQSLDEDLETIEDGSYA